MADNVTPFSPEDDPQTFYRYDEVVFYLPEDRDETVESIEENFADWWVYGSTDVEGEVTLEDRISALEEMFLMGMEV